MGGWVGTYLLAWSSWSGWSGWSGWLVGCLVATVDSLGSPNKKHVVVCLFFLLGAPHTCKAEHETSLRGITNFLFGPEHIDGKHHLREAKALFGG